MIGTVISTVAAAAAFLVIAYMIWREDRDQYLEFLDAERDASTGDLGAVEGDLDDEFVAAARAGLFDIPIEELSRLREDGVS